MSDNDLYISQGTCYFGPGQVSDRNFIPCGNAELSGPQSCCYVGDYCLAQTACWDNTTVVTYLAGCTDPTYSSSVCTNKFNYPDQQYVAIARCEGNDIDIWSGCSHHTNWTSIQKEPDCKCNASEPLIRNPRKQSTLDLVGSLPATPRGTISFTATAIPTGLNTASLSSSSPTSTPSPTSTDTADSSSSSGVLSAGQKAGIGVGVSCGAILIFALVFLAFRIRRRRQKTGGEHTNEPGQMEQVHVARSPPPNSGIEHKDEMSPSWTGNKPELHADPSYKSELSADPVSPPPQPPSPKELPGDGHAREMRHRGY